MLVTSNFSFSHRVFKRLVPQGRQKVSLCRNGLIWKGVKFVVLERIGIVFSKGFLFQNKCDKKIEICEKPERVENILGKAENAGYLHVLLFLQCSQNISFSRSLKVGTV